MTEQEWHDIGEFLSGIIQADDTIIGEDSRPMTAKGTMYASPDKATSWTPYHVACLVSGWMIMPIAHYSIREVWRNGNLIYKRGETMIQRSMF